MSSPGSNPNVAQIPNPTTEVRGLYSTAQALKQAVDSLLGFRGSTTHRAVTFDDLVMLGLVSEAEVETIAYRAVQPTAPILYTPANPTLTASAIGVMMGLGVIVSPNAATGALHIAFTGDCSITAVGAVATVQLYLGDAAAVPANGAVLVGAPIGVPWQGSVAAANQKIGFAIVAAVRGLSPIQQVWLDLSLATTAGNALIENINATVLTL